MQEGAGPCAAEFWRCPEPPVLEEPMTQPAIQPPSQVGSLREAWFVLVPAQDTLKAFTHVTAKHHRNKK